MLKLNTKKSLQLDINEIYDKINEYIHNMSSENSLDIIA